MIIERLLLSFRLWQADRAFKLYRERAKYHDGQKVFHRNAASEYRRYAYHYEAEVARLRARLTELPEPVAKRVEA